MNIEELWRDIKYIQTDERDGSFCKKPHGTCVLASFAIAAYPFVKKQVFEYFREICKYYKVDLNTGICPECYCSNHWGCLAMEASRMQGLPPHGDGYKTLWMLYARDVFGKIKKEIKLESYSKFLDIEDLLKRREPQTTAITSYSFYNPSKDERKGYFKEINDAHSIAVAYSERLGKFIVRDPRINGVKQYDTVGEIIGHYPGLGECIILKKKTN